jgi:hypothetical protein
MPDGLMGRRQILKRCLSMAWGFFVSQAKYSEVDYGQVDRVWAINPEAESGSLSSCTATIE